MRDCSKRRRWETASDASVEEARAHDEGPESAASGDLPTSFSSMSKVELETRLRVAQADLSEALEAKAYSSANALNRQVADLVAALEDLGDN